MSTPGRLAASLLAAAPVLAASSAPETPPDPPVRTVLLRVVDRLDRPVKDVTACLLPACAKAVVATTTEGPRVEVPAVPAKEAAARLRIGATGFAPVEVSIPAATIGPLLVRMKATGSITASFLSPDEKREESLLVTLSPAPSGPGAGPGKAIAEKTLALPARPKVAKVLFDDVPSGTWALSWNGPGVASGTKALTVVAVPADGGTVALQRGITVAGAVRDDLGVPVAGARLSFQERMSFDRTDPYIAEAVAGADGGFSISGVPTEGTVFWAARARGHLEAKGALGGDTRLEVVLERAQRVAGRAVDPDGRPLREVTIVVRYVTERSSRSHGGRIEVDDDGAFSFYREVPLKARVELQAKGFRQARREMEALPESGWPKEASLGEISLDHGRTIRGRAIDGGSGAPVAGAELKTTVTMKVAGALSLDQQEALSDEGGRFEVSGIPPKEPVALLARKTGFAPRNLDLGEADDELEVLLGRGGRVEGRLCGKPLELSRSEIWLERPGNGDMREGARKPDTAGRFAFSGVEPGRRTFVRAWFYESPLRPGIWGAMVGGTKASVVVEEGRTSTLTLGCDGIPLSGVLLREGTPVADKPITFSGPGGVEPDAMTDADGRFSALVPVPGPYEPYVDEYPAVGMKWAQVACHVPPGGLEGCILDLRPVPAQEKP